MIHGDPELANTHAYIRLSELHQEAARCRLADLARKAEREQAAREAMPHLTPRPQPSARALLAWLRGLRLIRA